MSNPRVLAFLHDIGEAIHRIQSYTAGMDYPGFQADTKTQDAVIRYGFVDVDFICAVDDQHPLAGRGTDWRLKIGDETTATIVDQPKGGIGVIIDAPRWAWWTGNAVEWERKPIPDPVPRPIREGNTSSGVAQLLTLSANQGRIIKGA